MRNLLYAALFLVLGLLEVHGIWAMLVDRRPGAEVVITLMDFVEEDLSRKLPASERINHTLLAMNYGAILMLLLPVLIHWAVQPTAIIPVAYGYWSVARGAGAPSACGCSACAILRHRGAHDGSFRPTRRTRRGASRPADVLVTGATGFIGRRLVEPSPPPDTT